MREGTKNLDSKTCNLIFGITGLHFAPLHSPLASARVENLGWPTGPGRCGCSLRLTILTFHFAKCSSNLFCFSVLVSSSDSLSIAAVEET